MTATIAPEAIQQPNASSTDSLLKLLRPITLPPQSPRAKFHNWAETFFCSPAVVFEPSTEAECRAIIELAKQHGRTVRAVGAGHSPSDLACTSDFMIRTGSIFSPLAALDVLLQVNTEKKYAIVGGGMTLSALHELLASHGLAMRNVGSISEQSLAGVISTATHGSGLGFRVMSDDVLSLSMLMADGSIIRCSRDESPDLFMATLCGIGATGLILYVQLAVENAFRLHDLQKTITFDEAVDSFDLIANSAEHVRLWWFPQVNRVRVSSASRTYQPAKPPSKPFYHELASHHLVQLLLFLARYFIPLYHFVAWFVVWIEAGFSEVVDDSYAIFNMDCRFPQHTTEWAIPYDCAQSCLLKLRAWLDQELADPAGLRPHFPIEIRFSDSDDIWLSPSNSQRTCWIGIVQYKPYGFPVRYRQLFRQFENILSAHGGRPHWAKAHKLYPAELRRLYPRFDDFVALIQEVDPQGLFRNEYVRRHVIGDPVDGRIFKLRALSE